MMRAAAAFPKNLFAGRSVFVTGGGSGINLGIATAFVELGAGVGICGRNPERLEGARELLVAAAGGDASRVVTAVADVRDYDAVEAALAKTEAGLGAPVSTLVAGAAGRAALRVRGVCSRVVHHDDVELCGAVVCCS